MATAGERRGSCKLEKVRGTPEQGEPAKEPHMARLTETGGEGQVPVKGG